MVSNGGHAAQLDTRTLPLPPPLYQLRILPAVPYVVRVAARNSVGESGWGAAATWRGPPAGSCANEGDLTIFRNQRTTLKAKIQDALIGCLTASNKTACATQKVMQNAGLSPGCSGCWVQEGFCTLKACSLICTVDPKGERCAACSEAHCFPAVEECGGVPRWAFPL